MKPYTYVKRPQRELELDVFTPARPNGCAILLLHGGALLVGDRGMVHPYAPTLMQYGYTPIAASYRLRTEALWPGPLEDLKAAVAWVRDHAKELGFDPQKIVLEGFSAGAMLSLLAAREVGAAAVVAFFSPPDAVRDPAHPIFLGKHLTAAEVDASSPLTTIALGYPPTMILHGMADTMVPPDAALALFSKLREVGSKADLRMYHGHEHEFCMEPSMIAPVQSDVPLFLDRTVVAPDRYTEESRTTNVFLMPGPGPTLPAPLQA